MKKEIMQGKGIPKEIENYESHTRECLEKTKEWFTKEACHIDDEAGLRMESPGMLVMRPITPINEDVTLSDLKRYAKKSRQKILVNIYPNEINVDITRLEE